MKKVTAYVVFAFILLLNGCKKTTTQKETEIPSNHDLIQPATIDAFIKQQIQTNKKFEWSTASDEMIWSALQQSDKILSVGYKPMDEINVEQRLADIDINSSHWKTAKQKVLEIIFQSESKTRQNLVINQLEVWEENVLPVMDIMVENFETVKLLRASNLVRYAEPMGYEPKSYAAGERPLSSSGCGSNVAEQGLELAK